MGVYLDYNSSAPIDARVVDKVIEIYRGFVGNADSRTHDFGNSAREIVENARKQVASILGVSSDEVFFTSGATESNNIAIQGLRNYAEKVGKKHIVTTEIEHKAVLETCKSMRKYGFEVDFVSPEVSGRVSADAILDRVRDDTILVSVMHVNNETGIIQPIQEVGERLNGKGVLFHVDATQSFGKLVDELRKTRYDMLSMSAHKIYGPQGIGALVLRRSHYKLPPIEGVYYGGQQEHGIRPGTLPIALIAGLGEACRIAENEYKEDSRNNKRIKEMLLSMLDESGIDYGINGDQRFSADSTISVYFSGIASEALMLSTKQFCGVSNGSACNSKSYAPSYVLSAMNVPDELIESTVRISWGRGTSLDQCKVEFENFLSRAKELR